MRKFESNYRVDRRTPFLKSENDFRRDVDLRLSDLEGVGGLVEASARDARDRVIRFASEEVAPLASALQAIVSDYTGLTEPIRDAAVEIVRGGVEARGDTLSKLLALIDASGVDIASLLTAIALKAPLASPAFGGVPTAPTAAPGANTAQLANTAFVHAAIEGLLGGAPGMLDTLNELAAALGDDANFATTTTAALAARLRFDAAQTLSADEKTQARSNLGLGALAAKSAVDPADLPAGARILLATLDAANSAALSDSSHFTSEYNDYEIIIDDLLPATNYVSLNFQIRSGGSYQSSAYHFGGSVFYSNNSSAALATWNGSAAVLSQATIANAKGGVSGFMRLHRVNQTASPKKFHTTLHYAEAGGGAGSASGGGFWDGAGAVDGVRFFASAGNLTSGSILIYGIKQ